jgi:hypothetical protein
MSKTLSLKKPYVAESTYRPEEGACDPLPNAETSSLVALAEALMPDSMQVVKPFTAAQLRAMLAEIEPNGAPLDPTMGLPIAPTDPAELAAKAALPPPEDRKQGAAPQLPPAVHGSFSLNGIPLIAPGVDLTANINPATNLPYVQVGISPKTIISPPPSRYFDGR